MTDSDNDKRKTAALTAAGLIRALISNDKAAAAALWPDDEDLADVLYQAVFIAAMAIKTRADDSMKLTGEHISAADLLDALVTVIISHDPPVASH